MKNYPLIILLLFLGVALGLIINSRTIRNSETPEQTPTPTVAVSEKTCLGDECLRVENLEYPAGDLPESVISALDKAINDEYKAVTTYRTITDRFGMVRPFSMIQRAEQQHINALASVYEKYGLPVPDNPYPGTIAIPDSLQAACQAGVEGEIGNVALYRDSLLPAVAEYEDITLVFTNLMKASDEKHLPAFERCN